jgi:hypothetical protein
MLGAAEIRQLAEKLDIRPTKKLGQNFVIDPNTIRRIVSAADLNSEDLVVEIGPGLGYQGMKFGYDFNLPLNPQTKLPSYWWSEINNLSDTSFVAPYRLIGAAALSVEMAMVFLTLLFNAAFITFFAPSIFV